MVERSKPKYNYQGFSLAKPFFEEIKEHIKDNPKYSSVTDYVKEAIREKMNEDNSSIWGPNITRTKTYQEYKKKKQSKMTKEEELEYRLKSLEEDIISLKAKNKKVITESQKKK